MKLETIRYILMGLIIGLSITANILIVAINPYPQIVLIVFFTLIFISALVISYNDFFTKKKKGKKK